MICVRDSSRILFSKIPAKCRRKVLTHGHSADNICVPDTSAGHTTHTTQGIRTMNTNENKLAKLVSLAISIIGSDRFDDVDTSDEDQIMSRVQAAIDATAGDLTGLQKNALGLLLAAYNGDANLCDETGDTIRVATMAEAVESGLASYEGVILVGGRRCYVEC